MTSRDDSMDDDREFAQFLDRQGPLAQQLQSLAQPAPSAELDAAILDKVQRELAGNARLGREASNDAAVPGASSSRPAFLRRWQVPIGLAASVMVAVLVALQWQGQGGGDTPLQIAQAPQAQETVVGPPSNTVAAAQPQPLAETEMPTSREPAARRSTKLARPAPAVAPPLVIAQKEQRSSPVGSTDAPAVASSSSAAPPLIIAQGDTANQDADILRSGPRASAAETPAVASAPATVAAPPAHNARTAPVAKYPAKLWLELIEELLKADLRRDAEEEWKQFRKAYPAYPLPDHLKKELNRSKEK